VGHPVTAQFLDEHARPQPGHGIFLSILGVARNIFICLCP
jgi:hypothetical protein